MPYRSVWVEPEVAQECDGVVIYHTYEAEDYDSRLFYWFTLVNRRGGPEPEEIFDVRELPNWRQEYAPEHVPQVLREAIKRGYITKHGVCTPARLKTTALA